MEEDWEAGNGWTVGMTVDGSPLTPGVNVDPVDVAAGMRFAAEMGYDDAEAQMVIQYALLRWRKGEEDGADRTFTSYYPRGFMTWRAILAHAITAGQEALQIAPTS